MKKPAAKTTKTTKPETKKSEKKAKRLTVDAVVKAGLEQCTFGNKSGCGD